MVLAWSACVVDADGRVLEEVDADRVHSTASVGKVFLLCELAERIVTGELDPDLPIWRDPAFAVADSGLWQYFRQETLPLTDACLLVAAVSDNWATNALLDIVGLDAVAQRAAALGCERSALHDRVRDLRRPTEAPHLSTGTARELAEVARRIHASSSGGPADGVSSVAARLVEVWLLIGVDLSMVAAPFALDPLAHLVGEVRVWSKTGSDSFVRADMGTAWNATRAYSYAGIATWSPSDDSRRVAIDLMHEFGETLRQRLA